MGLYDSDKMFFFFLLTRLGFVILHVVVVIVVVDHVVVIVPGKRGRVECSVFINSVMTEQIPIQKQTHGQVYTCKILVLLSYIKRHLPRH